MIHAIMSTHLIILTAPPASGKTFWMESFAKNFNNSVLFISPLRALAEECKKRSLGEYEIMTPEEWLKKRRHFPIVVIDEFHLFFYWGLSFRYQMWEAFYELVTQAELVIVLTATLTKDMRDEMALFQTQFDKIFWVDQGNQKLKFKPENYIKVPDLFFMQELVLSSVLDAPQTSLIFCQYRGEVRAWEERLNQKGYSVLSCVGGEAREFSNKLNFNQPPDFIVSTTVLSHGVNLPSIKRIFLTYPVKDINFWLQMIARGGRKGESFDVFALENPFELKWSSLFNFLAIQRLSLRIKISKLYKQIEEWFLKEL
jgi:ATP-dependent DNA helicase RecQ